MNSGLLPLLATSFLLSTASFLHAETEQAVETQYFRAAVHPVIGCFSNGTPLSWPEDDQHGRWILVHSKKTGEFLQLTLPNVLPGHYTLRIGYIAHAERGICQISMGHGDGSKHETLGKPIDQRGTGYQERDVGNIAIDRMGHRSLRLTVCETPDHSAKLSIVTITLIPNPQRDYATPTGLHTTQVQESHCQLMWDKQNAGDVLIARRGGKTADWHVVGFVPTNINTFTAAGLCDDTDYEFRICRYGSDGRSTWSPAISAQTPAADHSMRGHFISKTETNGRIGGGTMIQRNDSSLLLYAHYQSKLADQGRFEIHAMESHDQGQSWSKRSVVLADKQKTYMMPALLRLDDNSLLFCYTVRDLALTWGKRLSQRSFDDGKTWTEPVVHCDEPFTWQRLRFSVPTGPHDRLIQTTSGRIIYPIHFPHFDLPEERRKHPNFIATRVVYSDDRGATWQMSERSFAMRGMTTAATKHRDLQGFWEPSIVEFAPGQLLMYMRSNTGWYYESRSMDDGTTWTTPRQSSLRAPLCPAKLIAVGNGRIAAVFNGIIDYNHHGLSARWDLCSMVSDDAGVTWHSYRNLEFADPTQQIHYLYYCYPTLLNDGSNWHLCYYKNFQLVYQKLNGDWFAPTQH